VVAAGSGSALVFGLVGGVYADRWDRRKTMVASDVLRALAVATVPLAAHLGWVSLWHLGAVAVVVAGLDSLFDPALQASLPALAGDARTLRAANGLMDATRRLARVVGPGLAGVLAATLPVAHFFTLDALTFAVSGAAILSLGGRFRWKPPVREEAPKGPGGLLAGVREAFGAVGESRVLAWGFAATGLASAAFSSVVVVGAALLASEEFGGEVGTYGLILGAYGVGNVLSNVVVGSLPIRRPMAVLFLGKVVFGTGLTALSAAPTLWVAVAAAAVAAVGGPMGDLVLLTGIQTGQPPERIGKVYGLLATVSGAGSALGLALTGPLFALAGPRPGMACLSLAVVVAGTAGLFRFGGTGKEMNAPGTRGETPRRG
jgi:MFS family permease